MRKMFLYTVLFTLAGQEPGKNKYVEMFYIWLAYVKKNAGLGPSDTVALIVDKRTYDFLNSTIHVSVILQNVKFTFTCLIIPNPVTISDGMTARYLPEIFVEKIVYMYIDLDVLIVKPILNISSISVEQNTLCLMPEGCLTGFCYGNDLIEKTAINDNHTGFTSAWFMFVYCEEIRAMFTRIILGILGKTPPYFTIDQPFFNKEIYDKLYKNPGNLNILFVNPEYMGQNTFSINNKHLFVNFSGFPGEDGRHLLKMLCLLCHEFTGSELAEGQPLDHPLHSLEG